MKRLSMVFVLLLFVFVTAAFAGQFSTSASAGPTILKTVAEAKVSEVDTNVALTGRVVKVINADSFLFSDGTGELLVHVKGGELDKNLLTAQVDVNGMITQSFMYTEVSADSVSAHN